MGRSIDVEHLDEDISARLARLEVQMQHSVTHEQAMWAVLIVISVPSLMMLLAR